MNLFSSIQKYTAVLILTAFLLSAAGPSYAGLSSPTAGTPFNLPEAWGYIDEFYQAPHSSKTILYIQDAHDSLEAQENIAKMIGHLVKEENVKTVLEEGYEGPVPTDSLFGFIKDPAVREKISWFFLDKLGIGAAEYAHINRKEDFRLTGADSLDLHLENISAYRTMTSNQERTLRGLDETQKEIRMLEDRFFPKEFKEWIKLKERFESHALPLPDYLRRTLDAVRKKNPGTAYPLLEKILDPQAAAEKIDFTDTKQLFQEIDTLENNVAHSFLTKERDYLIFQHYKNLSLLRRLAEMKLTPEEFSAAAPALKGTSLREIASFIAAESGKSLALSTAWEDNLSAALRFYELAQARDEAVQNALFNWAQNKEEKTSVLVFGGFHKKSLIAIMRKLGFSYAVISPRISAPDEIHHKYYKQLMTEGRSDFEAGFSAARADRPPTLFLQPEHSALAQVQSLYQEATAYPDRSASLLGRTRFETREDSVSSAPEREAVLAAMSDSLNSFIPLKQQLPPSRMRSVLSALSAGTQQLISTKLMEKQIPLSLAVDFIHVLNANEVEKLDQLLKTVMLLLDEQGPETRVLFVRRLLEGLQNPEEAQNVFEIHSSGKEAVPGFGTFRSFNGQVRLVPEALIHWTRAEKGAKVLAIFPDKDSIADTQKIPPGHILDAIAFVTFYEKTVGGRKAIVVSHIQSDDFHAFKDKETLRKKYRDWRWVLRAALEHYARQHEIELILSPGEDLILQRWTVMKKENARVIYETEMDHRGYPLTTYSEPVDWEKMLVSRVWHAKDLSNNQPASEPLDRIFVAIRSRAENRSTSIHESMVSPLIYPRFILSAPPNAPYTRENFLEAPVKPMPENDRAMRTFQAILEQYRLATDRAPSMHERFQRMLENTTILAVDLPTIFYSPSRPLTLGHIIQISGKRRAILLPKKLLEFSQSNSPLELRKLAAYLDIGQQLIERYDEVSEYFRYENQSFRIGIQQAEAVDRMVSETVSHAVNFSTALTGPFFKPTQPNFPFLISADDALWREERQRLTQREEKMLENYQAIGEALETWNPKNGYSDAQIQRVSKKIALLIPERDPAILLARRDPHYNWQQPALTVIQRTLQSLQKRGFYYETEGKNNLAVDYYDKAAHLYRASQKIDFGGFFPLRAQEELTYFRLRTAGVEGPAHLKRRLEIFAGELRRAIKIEYTPEIRRKSQQSNHEIAFPIWLTLSAPDLYSKLQLYRPMADEATLELIDRIELMLRRIYFSELKRLASAETKFGVDLTQSRKNKLQNPLLVPVPESGDVFSFSWKKTDIKPGEHIAVRIMAHRWLGGPEIQDLAGYYHFELKKGTKGWRAHAAVGEWPGSTIKNVPNSAMVIDDYALAHYENLPHMISQLAFRLARRSGAVGFQLKLPTEIQERYELPYLGGSGRRSPKLWVPNLQSNPIVDKRVIIKPRETRNEARNIDKQLSATAQEPAALFVPYADLQNPASPLRKILFGMAYEIRVHKNTSMIIYGADLSDESLKPFREAGVHVEASDLKTARKRFGLEENPERNVHFSLTAETIRKNLGEPLLAFLSQEPGDIYAALLLARSGGTLPGVENKDGIYSLAGEILKAALAKHLQQLAVAIAA